MRLLISVLLFFSCSNLEEDVTSLKESVLSLEQVNAEQSNQIAYLQGQIDEIKQQQEEDRLAAEGYVSYAISSISQLSSIIEDLTSNFINQAANLALLQVNIETIEDQISEIETKLDLIDSTGDISVINELLGDIQDEINDNSDSIFSLISSLTILEIESEKYDSSVIGCYSLGDYRLNVLNNGIGFYELWKNPGGIDIVTFNWEKINPQTLRFYFPDLNLFYQDVISGLIGWYILPGEYDISLSNLEELLFPLGGNNQGWINADGNGSFSKIEGGCPN